MRIALAGIKRKKPRSRRASSRPRHLWNGPSTPSHLQRMARAWPRCFPGVVNLRGTVWWRLLRTGSLSIAGKRQVAGIGFSLASSMQNCNATNEGKRGDRRGNREQPLEDVFGALHDCASGMVFNRGEHIGGAGEGEPITSAIDMRDSAKAGKEPCGRHADGCAKQQDAVRDPPLPSPTQVPLREPLCSIAYARRSPEQPRARSGVRFFRTLGLAPSPLPLHPPTQAARVREKPGKPRSCLSAQS